MLQCLVDKPSRWWTEGTKVRRKESFSSSVTLGVERGRQEEDIVNSYIVPSSFSTSVDLCVTRSRYENKCKLSLTPDVCNLRKMPHHMNLLYCIELELKRMKDRQEKNRLRYIKKNLRVPQS